MRAILSVWDKTGLAEFARGLAGLGWQLYSTGRTQSALEAAGVPVTSVADLTGFPEILDGRVKTLHPRLHGGILARRDLPSHQAQLQEHGIGPIDLVVSNLYPFVETVAAQGVPAGALASEGPLPPAVQEAIEQIDIGGPTLTRAAAKTFEHVVVVTDPADYQPVLEALSAGPVSRPQRARLAQKAFQHTAQYDAYVAQYFAAANGESFADAVSLPLTKVRPLSYGENPHQQAAFYRLADPRLAGPSLADLKQLNGDAPSYNNLLDLDNAYAIVADFDQPAVAIVKHNNPCGVGTAPTISEAYRKAYLGDPVSAFGGVVAANRPVDRQMAEAMSGILYWVLVAPGVEDDALHFFTRIRRSTGRPARSTRVFTLPLPVHAAARAALPGLGLHYRPVLGGFLAQTYDRVPLAQIEFNVVSRRPPTEQELADLRFAWRVVKHVRSNAVVFAKDGAVVACGAGQMSRLDATVTAAQIARRNLALRQQDLSAGTGALPIEVLAPPDTGAPSAPGSVMATDGFFPFPDGVIAAARAGATAIVHPGGGGHDADAVAAADERGLAMVTTGTRHFRH